MGEDGVFLHALEKDSALLAVVPLQYLDGLCVVPYEMPEHALRVRVAENRAIQALLCQVVVELHRQEESRPQQRIVLEDL